MPLAITIYFGTIDMPPENPGLWRQSCDYYFVINPFLQLLRWILLTML